MPYSSINQQNINNSNLGSLPIMDTYANAILRTFASLESPSLYTSQNNDQDHCLLSTLIDESLDNQFIETESSSLSSSSSSIYEDQLILEACLPLASNNTKQFQRLLSRLDQFYNKQQQMLTKTILPSSTDINDRYFFHSNKSNKTKNKSKNLSPSSRKRYKFTSTNTDEIYNFSTNQIEQRAHSADSNRYHFSLNNSTQNERSRGSSEQRSMKLIDEPSNITSDTPYLFSKTTESLPYPSTTTTFIHPDDTWSYQRQHPQKISNINREYRQHKRMDTTTSTNGLLSILKPTDKSAVRSYLNEARERLSVKRSIQSPESLEKSVDRLVSSVNQKYGRQQQQQSQIPSTSTTTSLSYISQYYAKEEEPFNNDSIEYDNEQQRLYSSLNTNRIHTQIMKNVNKSLLDRNYQTDKNRFKNFEQNIRRYLRLYENQSLQRELNYNLIRCFSSSYLDDLRREEFRHNQTRNHIYSYTYEDIQDIYVPSVLEAYKMKTSVDRERSHRLQSSLTTGQLSPTSSLGYSPIMIGSSNENMDTQLGTLETDLRSYASNSQTPANVRLSVDVFYEIMQESFRGIDAYIAGHVSNASQYTKQKSQQSQTKTRDYESDIDIKSNSSFWSDEDENYYIDDIHSRKIIPHQRKISRYLSTVNRSLLDRPSNLIADFYLSKLNRNMQASVRHVEIIARDKAYKHEIIDGIKTKLNRSLSAEHLYQVRKEHLRYKQPFHTPTSFTTEDVADIYKPSILENYKRKIAIELERRRRQRQGQFLSNLHSPPIYTSEIKPSHSPIIDRSNHDFHIVSPPTIIQTKEIVMGRARRSLTEDGSEHFVHYIGTTLPPPIYSDNKQSSSKNRISFTATIYDQYDLPYITDVDSLDITNRKQMRIQQEKDSGNKTTDDTLKTAKQVITSHPSIRIPHRSKTKIYPSNDTLTEQIAICHANLIETDNHYLSMVNIDQTLPLQQAEYLQISSNDLQHAMIITSPQPPFSLVEHSNSEQITQFIQHQPKYEHTTLIISNDEHIARIQNDIPIFETVPDINVSIPSSIITNVNEIFNDDEHSLYIPQINEQPLILNSSHINQLEQLYDVHVEENKIQFNEELNQQETISNNEEQLPEIEKTTVDMEVSYIASFIQLPVNHTFPLASLVGELSTAVEEQHAIQIIDNDDTWKNNENMRMPFIIYDTEWIDEDIQIISNEFYPNLENAQHKYPEIIEYEQVQINLPQQLTNKSFEIIDNNEQVTFLSDDSNLNQHQQQTNIHIDELPYLENPLCPTTIFTLNYAHHKQKQDKKFYKNDDQFSSISSFLDMEIFLNHFEESLDHEQHLPLIDQISLSYTASCTGQYERNKRSLPIEWFQPTILSYDEQLVEQWTVIKDIDTIQQEGTLRHQQLKLMTSNSDCANIPIITNTNIFCIEKNFEEENCNSSILVDEKDNIQIFDNISHYSSTSDYEIDSVDKDNDTATYLINGTVIIPTSLTNILPSSSITNTTVLSQSSPLLTSYTAPIVPIVYFLDALAIEQTDTNNPTKEFLLTIGFGQNDNNSKMNEITNIVSTIDQPSLPTWINRPSSSDNIILLPTIIHNENPSISSIEEQKLNFAIENQIDNDDTALLLPSHRIQHGYDLGENTEAPLKSFFEPSYLHLPIINEIYIYQMSFHNEFSLFHPPNILPHMLVSKTHEDEIILPNEYQIKQSKILSFARVNDLLDKEESIQTILCTLNQPSYIEHCHIQPLYSFPETCFAEINQTEIINKNDINFLSDILTAFVKNKDDYELNQFDKIEPMQKITDDNQVKIKYGILDSLIATTTTTTTATEAMVAAVGVRPPVSTESGPIYEDVSFEKHVDVNMGTNGQYKEQAKYRYENETDISTKETTRDTVQTVLKPSHIPKPDDMILVPETIIEHISEDEKSITSEEVVFEEWSEEFRCRRTDEYDPTTKELIRSTIDETSDRIKGDVVKEEYKEKNVRIKGHKSYDVVKQIHRRVPASTLVPIDQVQTHVHEEISSSPQPITSSIIKPMTTTTSSSLQDQQWSTEEVYTTDIVQESYSTNNSGRNTPKIDTSTSNNFNHVRTGRYSPVPATTRANISTTPTTDYNYISEAISPTFKFADKRKEEFVSEEYHIEIETTKDQNETNGQTSPLRRSSDWRNELKQMYSSDNNRYDQYEKQINGNYIPYNNQQRVKEVQIKISTHHRTPSEPRKYEPYLSSKHTVKEVLVRVPQYHRSLLDDYKQKQKKNLYFFETPKKLPSTSTSFENDRLQPSKRSYSSSSILDDNRTQSIQTDRPTLSRIGVLKNTFQSSTNENTKDDTSKYLGAISAGLTEQRRKIFEEQEQANKEWNRRPINGYQSNEYRTNETHTGQSLVSNRISRFENIEAKEISRVQSTERLGRAGIDAIKLSLESSISKASPQTSFDVKMNNNKQIISSIDSDFMGPSQPIYQSTPKSIKQTYHEDQGRDSEDELSEPKQNYDTQQQQYLSKTRFRDFSQSTSPSLDTTHLIERTRFNEKSMENVLSHVPASRGKGVLIELSPTTYQTQTKSIYERNKPDITLDSGVFDRTTTTTTYQLPTSPASWRNNVSTSINDDGLHTNNNSIYIATAATRSNSPYPQRPITDTDDSLTRSTFKYNSEMFSNEPRNQQQQQQQRNVRRQVTQSAKTDYENPMNYRNNFDTQTKVPLTTQSRSVKPYVVDEIETIETETQVECQVQRTHETNESTKTERAASPIHSPNKIRSKSSYNLSDERTPAKRVFIQERPQYYESTRFNRSLVQNEEDITNRPSRLNSQTYRTNPNGLQLTSLSSQTHVTFDQNPSNEIIATVRIPELSNNRTIRHDRSKSEDDLYQNINGTGYRSSPTIQSYQQQLRSRVGATESTNNRSSPLNYSTQPTSSSSYQSTSYDQNRQQKQRSYSPDPGLTLRSQTQYHSRSLGNLDFEIEIEKRPPHESEQPTVVSLDQSSRAIVTTSKDGRVSIQNIAARPGNTVVINSDFHASDRSLNRSSGYFSSDEIRSQGHNTNYSSDEQSSGINLNSQSPSQRRQRNKSNDKSYHFDRLNNIVNQYSQSSNTSLGFNETIDQIDALYHNLDVETADRSYDFSKSNSRKQIELNPNEYPQRLTSVGFQHIPYEQQTSSTVNANVNNNNNNNNQKWTSSSINNIFTSTPIRPTQSASGGFSTPNSKYSSIQNMILHQNRFNPQSQIVQRNRASVKQVKQKNAARKRNTQEPYSDDDDDNDLSLRINASLHQRPQSSSRSYTYNN